MKSCFVKRRLAWCNLHEDCFRKFVLALFLEGRDPVGQSWKLAIRWKLTRAQSLSEKSGRRIQGGEMKEFLNYGWVDRIVIAETGGGICN